MQKKLTEEKQAQILEAGIAEFAAGGLENASMNAIAKRAGISVGVLYKYHADKEALFAACLDRSLSVMEDFLTQLLSKEEKPLNYARELIRAVQRYSREHADYIRMYHEVTSLKSGELTERYVKRIEGLTSKLYTEIVRKAQERGDMRRDLDPGLFAFFFDNLMMMMQFTYSCPYYSERYRLYSGCDIYEDDERVAEQLIMFLESAFTFEQAQVPHAVKK